MHALGNVFGVWLPSSATEVNEQTFCAAVNAALPSDIKLLRRIPVPSSFNARACCEARRYHYVVPTRLLRAADTADEDVLTLSRRLKKVLLQWRGTHNFANFTKPSAEDAALAKSRRHVRRVFCENMIELGGRQYAVISISGQSFMYHQVRKMMGATIAVMRGDKSDAFIKHALRKTDVAVDALEVPLAPAEGLVLRDAVYTKYCGKHNVERIGNGTKECRQDKIQAAQGAAEAAALVESTSRFQISVYEQIVRDQGLLSSVGLYGSNNVKLHVTK